MAIETNANTTYSQIGIREDLANIIYNISPEDTPFMSGAARGTASNTLIEWQLDSLTTAVSTNAQLEGDDSFNLDAIQNTSRVGNYTTISRKSAVIPGTVEAVERAGRGREMSYQVAKKGAELKRDMEVMLLENLAGDAGGTATARQFATLGAWLKSAVNIGSGGGNPVYTSGVPGAVRTDGTPRAFTTTILKDVVSQSWTEGGKVSVLMVGPVNKARVSGFAGVAVENINQTTAKQAIIVGAASVYVSDFGNLSVVPNRFQRERDGWFLDFDFVSVDFLRPFMDSPLAKTGDSERRMLLVEFSLRVRNEAALGLAADLTTT